MGATLGSRTAPFRLGEFRVDPARLTLAGSGATRHVEPRVMDVLAALAERAPEPVSRDELIERVWGAAAVTDSALSRCIAILRKELGDDRAHPRYIETLSKNGYRLMPPVEHDGPSSPEPDTAGVRPGNPKPVSIAVLPFVNLSGDAADDPIADGLTELLIAKLGGVAAMRVVARTSSMIYKASPRRLRDIAAELGVDWVVEGSIHRVDSRIQVVAQLIEARSETHAWANRWTHELRDLLSLLNDIARSVASAVTAQLMPIEADRLAQRVTIGEIALRHYLRGRLFWSQRGADALHKACAEFAACVREAPDFAPAHTGLADCHVLRALYGIEAPLDAAVAAREHHARAFALDPRDADVQTTLGAIRLFFDWDLDGAEAALVRALASHPSHTTARLACGDVLVLRGEFDSGLRLLREAIALNPFDLGLNMNLGDFFVFARRFGEAIAQFEHTLGMDARFIPARLRLAEAHALSGDRDAAIGQAGRAFSAAPAQQCVRQTRAFVLAAGGRPEAARAELVALAAERDRGYASAWTIARTFAVMGDVDAAIAWLSAAVDERAPMTLFAAFDPALDPIRADPRLAGVLRRIGVRLAHVERKASEAA